MQNIYKRNVFLSTATSKEKKKIWQQKMEISLMTRKNSVHIRLFWFSGIIPVRTVPTSKLLHSFVTEISLTKCLCCCPTNSIKTLKHECWRMKPDYWCLGGVMIRTCTHDQKVVTSTSGQVKWLLPRWVTVCRQVNHLSI